MTGPIAYAQMQKLRQECGMVSDAQEPTDAPQLEGIERLPFRDPVPRMCGELEYLL